ncbi:MAG: mandelate racemase/muconate lactonizing enzyme family protein [Chloroflexota bacterium]|nr:mandelate racemase/muconate lactonizing enzyme family protein [Chloroflexota bacterium]
MKITRVTATAEAAYKEAPIQDALQTLDTNGQVRVRIETDEGISGESSTYFGRVYAAPKVLALLIEEAMGLEITGDDPFLIRGIRDRLWKQNDYHGVPGLALFGIAAIDLALWDLMGKALEQPVWRLLGAHRDRVPAYAMVGWLNYDNEGLKRICAKAVDQGFRGVKIKVGSPTLAEDVARIEAVRSVLGPEHHLMVDANQALSVHEALRRGAVYQEMGCYWFEEPIRADDTDGHARLVDALRIPIATGENLYGQAQFRNLFERRGVGIVQPDIRRAGGLTECLEIGLMAKGFNIPYASHGGGAHLHVLAALPNTLFIESSLMPDDGSRQLVDGCYPLPETPGLGTA